MCIRDRPDGGSAKFQNHGAAEYSSSLLDRRSTLAAFKQGKPRQAMRKKPAIRATGCQEISYSPLILVLWRPCLRAEILFPILIGNRGFLRRWQPALGTNSPFALFFRRTQIAHASICSFSALCFVRHVASPMFYSLSRNIIDW